MKLDGTCVWQRRGRAEAGPSGVLKLYIYIYRILVPTSRAHTFLFLQEECSERNCWVIWSLRDSFLKRVVSAGHEGSYPCALVIKSVVGYFLATPIGV